MIDLPNLEIEIVDSRNYSLIKTGENSQYPFQSGTPAIPLRTIYFEVPANSEISDITVIPQDVTSIKLNKQLFPVQQAVPLLSASTSQFTEADPEIYRSQKYPLDPVFNLDQGFCGDRTIGYASLFTAAYYPEEQTLEIPGSYSIEIEFSPIVTRNLLPAGKVSDKIAFELELDEYHRNDTADSYLLITTEQLLPAFQDLLNWRRAQGVNVFWITRDEIETQYTGRDLQEKIRNCIIDYYLDYQISFVTLGGDVDHIPDRKVFAFDCEFGAYEDENDIPSDMYYSCLQGSWDANDNSIFGEDTDEIDYFPEVYVGRIPVNTILEIEDYTSRLISYESGEIENYNKAAGFSMQLWPGSNSEICQQYIYDMYFPDYYDIQFFYGEENNQQNAYEIMNSGQNFIQHTGHAGRLSMGLESGRISLSDIDSLYNEWGGLFYSIGCWSAAFDYDSIGENLVSQTDRGFLGFVGNSRYGWGAPSASGFGFSEFFQKAFFRDLFEGNTRLAEINALQKLDFIPYYNGTSVYKWVAYELNALGDAYLNLSISNPAELYYSLHWNNGQYQIIVSDSYGPLENVIISGNEISVVTDNTGEAIIPGDTAETELVIFKSGYRSIFLEFPGITDDFLIELTGLSDNLDFIQGETFSLEVELTNCSTQDEQFLVIYEYNPEEITLDHSSQLDFIAAGTTIDLTHLNISLNPISASYQMQNGKEIYLNIKVLSATNNYLLTERQLAFTVTAPEIVIEQFILDAELISPDSAVPVQLDLVNIGSNEIFGLDIQFSSTSPFLDFEDFSINLDNYLAPGDGLMLNNIINIESSAPSDLQAEIQFVCSANSHDQIYTFQKTLFLTAGHISFTDFFDSVDMWQLDLAWQLVSSECYSADYALSCRPQFIGTYWATSPLLSYLPGMEINFQYKYKMPMYGNDGVYLLLETENIIDTLLFLGAGGALPIDIRTPQTYIESDWAEYQLNLDEIMLAAPEPGTQFSIKFLFTVPEIYEDFNEYSEMDEIGVFLDDLKIGQPKQKPDSPGDNKLLIFPNPSRNSRLPRFSVDSRAGHPVTMKIYDIKGRLISQMQYQGLGDGRINLFWDGLDAQDRVAASGIYFILIDTGIKKYRGKFIYIN
jgi:hypothetical protein